MPETTGKKLGSALALAGYLCLFAAGFSDNARGPLMPEVKEHFRCSALASSLLLVLGSLAGGPGSLAAGALVGRWGPRATLRLMAATLALGLAVVALAGWTSEFALVPAGAAILGLGLAGLGVLANYYVTLATPLERRAAALSRLHVTYAAASLVVPQLVGPLALRFPWPVVLAGVAAVPLLLLPVSLAIPFTPPPALPATGQAPRASRRIVLVYALAVSLFVIAEVTVSAWLTLHAAETDACSPERRPLLLSGFFLGLGTARFLGGSFLTASRLRPAIAGGALASAAVVLLGLHASVFVLPLEGLTIGILFPATVTALTLEIPQETHASAIGSVSAVYSVALALAHLAVGRLSDLHGTGVALHVSPVCALLGIAVLGLAWRTSPRDGRLSVS